MKACHDLRGHFQNIRSPLPVFGREMKNFEVIIPLVLSFGYRRPLEMKLNHLNTRLIEVHVKYKKQ